MKKNAVLMFLFLSLTLFAGPITIKNYALSFPENGKFTITVEVKETAEIKIGSYALHLIKTIGLDEAPPGFKQAAGGNFARDNVEFWCGDPDNGRNDENKSAGVFEQTLSVNEWQDGDYLFSIIVHNRPAEGTYVFDKRTFGITVNSGRVMEKIINQLNTDHLLNRLTMYSEEKRTVKKRVFINSDIGDYLVNHPTDASEQTMKNFVDFMAAGTSVSDLVFCVSAQNAFFDVAADGWEPIWVIDGPEKIPATNDLFFRTIKSIADQRIDMHQIMIGHTRKLGVKAWMSFRMNDMHGSLDKNSYMNSKFYRQHPEFYREPEGKGWNAHALDYSFDEVKDHHLKIIEAALKKYDADGIELDWIRNQNHFSPSLPTSERCRHLTIFMNEVKVLKDAAARRRKHKIYTAVRVPAVIDVAKELGMDTGEWIAQGLVDVIIPSTALWTTSFDIKIEDWMQLLTNASGMAVPIILAGAEGLVKPYYAAPAFYMNPDFLKSFSAVHYARGAEGVYLFNYAYNYGKAYIDKTLFKSVLAQIGVQNIFQENVRLPVTFFDMSREGKHLYCPLPVTVTDDTRKFNIFIGVKPVKTKGAVLLGFGEGVPGRADSPVVRVNSYVCTPSESESGFAATAAALTNYSLIKSGKAYEIEMSKVINGYNEISIMPGSSDTNELKVVWLEVNFAAK